MTATNTIDQSGNRSFPNISIETKMLVDHFKEKPEGSVTSYADLENMVGRSCRPEGSGYRYLCSAKKILLRDYDVVLDAEPKIGVRVCTNEEKMVVSERDQKRGRRAFIRSNRKLDAVEYDRLESGTKVKWNARKSTLGALLMMSTPKASKKVEKLVTDHVLPSASILDLFKS